MLNIDLGIRPGEESLIREQLNDPVCKEIGKVYIRLLKLRKLYLEKKSINRKEFNHEFNLVMEDFRITTNERFGIDVQLRNSNTFAVMPIFNPDQFSASTFNLKKNKDLTHGIKQIKDFTKWLDSNDLILDKKEAKFINLPKDYYVPLFVSIRYLDRLTEGEFISIILHEIGHVFTLLEMYSKTAATTSILLTNFLRNKNVHETTRDLKITKKFKGSEESGLSLIFDKVKSDLGSIKLGGHGTGETDSEVEADNFTVKFGYGAELSKALIKMNEVHALTFTNAGAVITLMSILGMDFRALLLSLLIPGGMVIMAAIALEIGLTINNIGMLLYKHNKRNPINDEHGSLKDRVSTLKTSLIEILRMNDTNKSDTKLILSQYNMIENDLSLIDKSAHGKVLIGLMSEYLIGNLNTEDALAHKLNELENNKLYIQEARFSTGLESINYQGKKDPIVNELITFFAKLKDSSIVRNITSFMNLTSELEDLTYKRFGISIQAMPAFGITGGWACIPFNILRQKGLSDWKTYYTKGTFNITGYLLAVHNNRNILRDFKNGNDFKIDLKNAKISGMNKSKHKNIVFIEFGRDMFGTTITGLDLTPEEMTAVYLHEIGHLFTYFESLKRTIASNTLLLDNFNNRTNKDELIDIKYKKEYVDDYKELFTLNGFSLSAIKQFLANGFMTISSSFGLLDSSFGMMVLSDIATKDMRLGSVKTFMTDSEVVADDFSTRLGMGKELVSGLDRLITYKIHNKAFVMLPMVVGLTKAIIVGLAFSGRLDSIGKVGLILMLNLKYIFLAYSLSMVYRLIAGQYFPYEKLPERFDSIARTLISTLRESDLSKSEIKEILDTISEVKATQKEINDLGYGSLLLSMFIPTPNMGKNITLDGKIIDNLDKLINNDLIYNALRFESLESGNEAMNNNNLIEEPTNTVYYKEFTVWSDRINELVKGKELKDINLILSNYGLNLEKNKSEYLVKSNVMVNIREGYTGFTIFEKGSEDESEDKTVVTLTIDTDKVIWLLKNPFI
ncbi:hypothetical protein DRJ25_02310, partial [Candidatus Woesearchaeota archaeon]